MPNDLIRYDLLVQEALCGVVKKVLGDAARHGLPGDHHFYITFRTHAPGVRLSSRMRESYPQEMTIILQHQFEDLKVTDHAFEVGLSFKGVPEILLVPFDALTGFFDPSVQFSAKFEPHGEDGEAEGEGGETSGPSLVSAPLSRPTALPSPTPALAAVPRNGTATNGGSTNGTTKDGITKIGAAHAAPHGAPKGEAARSSSDAAAPSDGDEAADQPKVVSIDAFRKKP